MNVTLFVDGASRGNPGPAGIGVYAYTDNPNEPIFTISCYLGRTTNNVAEYAALAAAMEHIKNMAHVTSVRAYADSELLVKQINGIYRVKNPTLAKWHALITNSLITTPFKISHVLRHKNTDADRLANAGIDNRIPLPASLHTIVQRYINR